ncbi:SICAvar, type I [Plasmodium knowlesi strain H]|uniref:SICAvar, type I n=2 Tax=Plasmodium knowlesi TaxID=5850 RepID=A0A679L3B1_PLAKH|nr:SICAvar, type I [Plasmodium knowlesi strain H]OTN64769.1 SICAvar type I [Plasmodium knowlesi]CAA9989231.1 SICAvar, type I [Plasmodium knowlesi strain H]VVS78705.1 SICAvar, type I [Plasmodium knowlesi strain H]
MSTGPTAAPGAASAGLLEEWMKAIVKNNAGGVASSDPEDIIKRMKDDLRTTWEKLGSRLKAQEAQEIRNLCFEGVKWAGKKLSFGQQYMGDVCMAMAEVRYFTSGLKKGNKRSKVEVEAVQDHEWYPRCLVGAVALSEIYGDHCHLGEVVNEMLSKMEGNLQAHGGAGTNLNKCENVNPVHLMLGKSILRSTIKDWAQKQREAKGNGGYRVGGVWDNRWPQVCNNSNKVSKMDEQERKKWLNENKASMVQFMKLGNTQGSGGSQASVLADVLADPDSNYTFKEETLEQVFKEAIENGTTAGTPSIDVGKAIEKLTKAAKETEAEACMKKEDGNFCERLKCAKKYWELTNTQPQNFWDNYVEGKLKSLITDTTTNRSTIPVANCEDNSLNSANKAACTHMAALLNHMYTTTNGTNELSDQIIKCVLLNAYAKKLKDEAKNRGLCDINEGINTAFTNAATGNSGIAIPCKWEDSDYEKCSITTNGTPGNVKDQVQTLFNNNEPTQNTKIPETLAKFNKNNELCEWVNCAAKRAQEKKNSGSGPGTGQEKFWTTNVKNLWDELAGKMKNTNGTGSGCDSFGTEAEKWACKYLHAGFKQLYEPEASSSSTTDDILSTKHPSFRQTMGCFLLHAYAKYMQKESTCNIEKGIKQAFETAGSGKGGTACNGANGKEPCVPCQWQENILTTCQINTNGSTGPDSNVDNKLKDIIKEGDTNINDMLTNINKRTSICEHMKCIASHLNSTNGQQHSSKQSADDFWTQDVTNLWNELAGGMLKNNGAGETECKDLPTNSEKMACKYLHAGFNKLKSIAASNDTSTYRTLKKDPSFVRTMGCLLFREYAKQMEKKSTCVINAGIRKAFDSWGPITNGQCTDGSSCIECKWDDDSIDNCIVQTSTSDTDTPGDKVQSIFKKDKDKNISTMLTAINKMETLCDGLKCLASHLNSSTGKQKANNFWTTSGEVGQLWQELIGAMMEPTVNGQCDQVDNGSRTPTEPERKACQHLTTFFSKLKGITTSDDNKYTILRNPSLKRTMGCILLHAYAKKMKSEAKCEIEAGIKEAFDTAGKGPNGTCNGSSGTEPCVPCQWDEKFLDTCQITISSITETADKKLEQVKNKIDGTTTAIVNDMNGTKTLCDKLQCAAGKWFEKHSKGGSGSNKKSWCDFWDTAVNEPLKKMFAEIQKNGANEATNNSDVCNNFGDNNPNSVERKACNHITAGLEHIRSIKDSNSTNPLLDRAVGCIALNMYADEIIKLTKENCPIEEKTIKQMFEDWNKNKNSSCSSGANNCFECKRKDNFNNCHLSVSGALVETQPKNGNCIDNDNRKNVQKEMNKFLEDNQSKSQPQPIPEVKTTLTTITDITTSSFCTQLQCATKKYAKSKNGKISPWDDLWTDTGEVATLWKELSQAMTKTNGDNYNGGQCGQMDDNGEKRTPTEPEKRACNFLHAGLKQLFEPTTGTPSSSGHNILSEHQSLRHTVGCFLLKEYAKKMEKESKCVINSGLKKAFETAGKDLIGGQCKWDDEDYGKCQISTTNAGGKSTQTPVENKLTYVQSQIDSTSTETLTKINHMSTLCEYIRCAGPKWFKNKKETNGSPTHTWCNFWDEGVKPELEKMFNKIATDGQKKSKNDTNDVCKQFGDENPQSVERKACNHIAEGLKYISEVQGVANGGTQNPNSQNDDKFFKQTMMCAALNLYATKIRDESKEKCPIDEDRIKQMFTTWNDQNKSSTSCPTSGGGVSNNNCFKCERNEKILESCELSVDSSLVNTTTSQSQSPNGDCNDNEENKKVQPQMTNLLNEDNSNINTKMNSTLTTITDMTSSFCTQLQCAAKKYYVKVINKNAKSSGVNWKNIEDDAKDVLTELIEHMTKGQTESEITKYCNDRKWDEFGHKGKHTNKAACLLFAAGLQHIYTHGNGQRVGPFKGPSFEQTMGCLFLKEYAKQLKNLANREKKYKVHPDCSVDKGIEYAFSRSKDIMEKAIPQCKKNASINDCFVCTQNNDYNNCKIGDDNIGSKSKELFTEPENKEHMQQTLENTVCPILLTDILTPFLPLAPVSIGLSAMAYYLWKYFGPLGKGGPRFRRSPAEIPGSSVQEQVLDHVQQDSSHEYRLVKERKPRSAPTRTKRSDRANRRTIIEIHFEVLDECQKGDTQLNQKDILELLVQEFMGSEFMEEEQVPKEEVLMEGVPLERVPMERVPSLGSVFMV